MQKGRWSHESKTKGPAEDGNNNLGCEASRDDDDDDVWGGWVWDGNYIQRKVQQQRFSFYPSSHKSTKHLFQDQKDCKNWKRKDYTRKKMSSSDSAAAAAAATTSLPVLSLRAAEVASAAAQKKAKELGVGAFLINKFPSSFSSIPNPQSLYHQKIPGL